ncbi:MAG: response regulator [Gemmatimonadales bacterium]
MSPLASELPVLLVDDDLALTRTLEDILPLHGFQPRAAQTARTALQLMGTPPRPVIAVVDLRLPDMDGLDLAAQLHTHSRELEVVILTGNGSIETAVRAFRDKNCDYLLKPVDPEQLVRALRTAESRWRLRLAQNELKKTQSLLGGVFDASPLPMVAVDQEFQVQLWSKAAETVFGIGAEEAIGTSLIDWGLAPRNEAGAVLSAAKRGRSFTGIDLIFARRDGRSVDLRLSVAPLNGTANGAAGLVLVYEDTSERRRIEERLQDAQRLDALGRLAGGVAHDFANLLAVILGEADVALADPTLPHPFVESLTAVRDAAHRGSGLTRQLLSFARRQPSEPTLEDVNEVVTNGRRLLQRLAGGQARVKMHLVPTLAGPGRPRPASSRCSPTWW